MQVPNSLKLLHGGSKPSQDISQFLDGDSSILKMLSSNKNLEWHIKSSVSMFCGLTLSCLTVPQWVLQVLPLVREKHLRDRVHMSVRWTRTHDSNSYLEIFAPFHVRFVIWGKLQLSHFQNSKPQFFPHLGTLRRASQMGVRVAGLLVTAHISS